MQSNNIYGWFVIQIQIGFWIFFWNISYRWVQRYKIYAKWCIRGTVCDKMQRKDFMFVYVLKQIFKRCGDPIFMCKKSLKGQRDLYICIYIFTPIYVLIIFQDLDISTLSERFTWEIVLKKTVIQVFSSNNVGVSNLALALVCSILIICIWK